MNSLYSFSAAIVYTQCDPIRKPLSFYKAKTKTKTKPQNLSCSFRHPYNKLRVSALKSDPSESHQTGVADDEGAEKLPLRQNDANFDSGWLPAFPHVLVASMSNFIFGYHIGAQAHSLNEVIGGRFLVGLGIGVNTVLVPIYISEVAPTKYRGALGSLCQIGTCLGIITSLILGIPSENDPHWWRTMLYIASIPGILVAIGMQFTVDSPRWLCKAGRINDAKTVIRELWGESEIDSAIEEFQSVCKSDGSDSDSRWSEILEEPHSRVAFIGGALFVLQQFAGINGVLYFSSLTFQEVGVESGAVASLFVGLTNFAGALCALYLIDREGRQKLLIGSYLGMAISMFLVSSAVFCPLDEQLSNNLSILGTIMYIFSFAIGAGPVTGIIISELSSTRTRGKIMGLSFSTHWVCNFIVGLFFLELVEKFGVAPIYASFGAVSLSAATFAYYFIVETKGRSLEEIERSLNVKA
ncbi:probable plastidic glucose transporter 1 isoform X4 [Vigna unguiculata]|uniref:probable plastidic glucose transporter 1 isoform X4 n=1 Tax=Vigna unguiculata TaxID=3917 RepID=UPI00101696F2|nr:probable plastidic glucose transporter 1 isoform X4 [Vigna unguiculata]